MNNGQATQEGANTPIYSYFNGQLFTCHNFGHKEIHCVAYKIIMTREIRNQHNVKKLNKSSYNALSPLHNEVECSIFNHFGHEETECKHKMIPTYQHEQKTKLPNVWKRKIMSSKKCDLALYAGNQENLWYIDNGFSKYFRMVLSLVSTHGVD